MKRALSLGIAALGILGLIGCGDSKPAPTAKPKASAVTPATPSDTAEAPAAVAPPAVVAEGWGSLTGRFVLTGTAPASEKIAVTKDAEVCGKHDLLKENLVVSSTGGLANVIVYVRTKDVKVHPDLEAVPDTPGLIDNLNCRFDPHIILVRAGQKITLKNSDPIGHNTKADLITNTAFNMLLPAGGEQEVLLASAERMPVPVGCNIHPWMQGYLYVGANPYMAFTDADGKFTIDKLPSGELEFQLWHESVGYLSGVKVQDKEAAKGRAKIVIQPESDNDLGEINVDVSLFK